jgi:hypothetical protein
MKRKPQGLKQLHDEQIESQQARDKKRSPSTLLIQYIVSLCVTDRNRKKKKKKKGKSTAKK